MWANSLLYVIGAGMLFAYLHDVRGYRCVRRISFIALLWPLAVPTVLLLNIALGEDFWDSH